MGRKIRSAMLNIRTYSDLKKRIIRAAKKYPEDISTTRWIELALIDALENQGIK